MDEIGTVAWDKITAEFLRELADSDGADKCSAIGQMQVRFLAHGFAVEDAVLRNTHSAILARKEQLRRSPALCDISVQNCKQLIFLHGLEEIVQCFHIIAVAHVLRKACDKDDGQQIALGTETFRKLHATQSRHFNIQQQQVAGIGFIVKQELLGTAVFVGFDLYVIVCTPFTEECFHLRDMIRFVVAEGDFEGHRNSFPLQHFAVVYRFHFLRIQND